MAYEVIILGHLHMPLYFLGTFTEYPYLESLLLVQSPGKAVFCIFYLKA